MSTKTDNTVLEQALANVPKAFRTKLIDSYLDIKRAVTEAKYDSAGLKTGKFCEVLVRLLQHEVLGVSTPFGKKIPNMADECRKIITAQNKNAIDSIKLILPRALVFLYTLRNKRGIGHVGGDIDANSIDIATMARTADWVVCELVRIYHKMPIEEAQDLLDSISVREIPTIWEVAGKKRILKDGLSAKQKTLLLLYSDPNSAILTEDLCDWIEYKKSMFASRVLNELHKKALIEYDRDSELVYLSPKGAKVVESEIL